MKVTILTAEKIVKRFAVMNIVLSEADKRAFIQNGTPPNRLATIPRPADLTLADEIVDNKETLREKLGLEKKKKIAIFTGRREYPPNMEAAEWIVRELAPAIAKKLDNVQILMTGAGKKPAATHPIVTFTGLVPNLFEYIHASDICIAPIEMPSGRLTKAFDSLSCSTPTVVLTSATNGIPELVDGDNAIIARDRNNFIEKTIYFLEHPTEAGEIGLRGRKMMEEYYGWNVWEERLNKVLNGVIKK
jgi:glycosyltransferase involved in cell wall biosynthesis